MVKNCTSQHCFACKRKHHISICESRINLVKKDNSSENQAPQNKIINSKGNNESGSTSSLTTLLIDHLSKNSLSQTSQANNELGSSSSSTTLLIDHSSKNSLLQTAQALISSMEEMSNSTKIEKHVLFDNCSQKSFIMKQLQEQLNLKVLKTEQMFIKTFASSEPTLQNLEVVEVKIANVENSSHKIINVLVVPLICMQPIVRSVCKYCKESI